MFCYLLGFVPLAVVMMIYIYHMSVVFCYLLVFGSLAVVMMIYMYNLCVLRHGVLLPTGVWTSGCGNDDIHVHVYVCFKAQCSVTYWCSYFWLW